MSMEVTMSQNHNFGKQGMCIEKLLASRNKVKTLKKENKKTEERHPELGQPINWKTIQGTEGTSRVATFSPEPEVRRIVMKLMTTSHSQLSVKQKAKKVEIIGKLRTEFLNTYGKYRSEVDKEKGRLTSWGSWVTTKVKVLDSIVINCLNSGITPVEVLYHWHNKLTNFANSNLEYIPINTLGNGTMIEEAAMNASSSKRKFTGLDESKVEGWKPPKRKAMFLGDTSVLHPRLRREMMAAGFNLSDYNDSDLSVIQDYAMGTKMGSIAIIPRELREMIAWALKNTLKNCEPKDFNYRE